MGLYDDAVALTPELSELRHSLHREPEIGLDLPRTQAKVLAALDGLPLEITLGRALSSVTGVLRGAHPGPDGAAAGRHGRPAGHRAHRLPYASEVNGAMHACGHDLHTSMLAGAARLLCERRGDFAGNVVFMFQPGEEGYVGPKHMIEEGVLDAAGERPVAAYALHVMSAEVPLGVITSRPGPILAAADKLDVTVHGAAATAPCRIRPRTRSPRPARWSPRCRRGHPPLRRLRPDRDHGRAASTPGPADNIIPETRASS